MLRHSTAAIGGLLVWGFVVENLFTVFLPEPVARFLPFYAGNHLLAGYTALVLVVGTVLIHRRDTD